MVKPRVRVSSELGPIENLRGPLEEQLTSALDAAVEKVDGRYDGEGPDQVAADLLASTKAALHPDIAEAIAPDQQQLRSVADTIVAENS